MKKLLKSISVLMCAVFLSVTVQAFTVNAASDQAAMDIHVNDEIGFTMYQIPQENSEINLFADKYSTSDSYEGYFYYINSGDKISTHTFTAEFTYDNTLATCTDTKATVKMVDDKSKLKPVAENKGENNLTATQVFGYVTFVLYNPDDTVNAEVSIKIYCNQEGNTWVNRQG